MRGPWPLAARGFLAAQAAECVVSGPPPRGEGNRGEVFWGTELELLKGKGAPGGFKAPDAGLRPGVGERLRGEGPGRQGRAR